MPKAETTVAGSPLAVPATVVRRATIALLGNPNTGKTTLFNALSGLRQRVGNYPGVTVETKKGTCTFRGETLELVDLPGTYSLAPRSLDEMLAVDLILGQQAGERKPDVILSIVDASNLERNLYLTTQALELGIPVVVALNMVDVARKHGLRVDAERLARQLGVPVVPIQANRRIGLEELKEALVATVSMAAPSRQPIFPEPFEAQVEGLRQRLGPNVPAFLVRRLLLDVGGAAEHRFTNANGAQPTVDLQQVQECRRRLNEASCPVPAIEARVRYAWIREITAGCIERPRERPVTWTDRLDRVLTHRLWGTLFFLALMFIVFQSIFTWAQPLMKFIGDGKDVLAEHVRHALPPGPLTSLIADGALEGVGSVLMFLPQIVILFGFIAVLEDCGYMSRAAFLMDKLMSRCGLSGKSFIPMLSSVACAVPGIMATRVIEQRRDRVATMLVAPLMTCSARLPVYTLLIGAFLTTGFPWWVPGVSMFALYAVGLVLAPLVAFLLKRTLLRGETPAFLMEMPDYKWPSLRTVVRRVVDSGWAFVCRAGTLILAAMILVWALLYFPRGDGQGGAYDTRIARLQERADEARNSNDSAGVEKLQTQINALDAEWKQHSFLGQAGRAIEPAVRPLGWDWKIGMAALASFPAREVVVGTLGIVYDTGKVDVDEVAAAGQPGETDLGKALRHATWDDDPGRKVFTVPTVWSLLVFFALCCQCVSTLAVIRRETRTWRWPAFTFTYMTILAYVAALVVYQCGRLFI